MAETSSSSSFNTQPLRGFEVAQLLLRTNIFYDETRTVMAEFGVAEFDNARHTFCTFALTCLARARRTARQEALANEEYNPQHWNAQWLCEKNLADVRALNPLLRTAARQLIMLNNLERESTEPPQVARTEELWDHQHAIFDKIIDGVFRRRTPPKFEAASPFAAAGVVVVPTGGGKTALAGDLLYRLGIGGSTTPEDPAPLKALVVTVSQDLVDQMSGRTGNNTLRRFLGKDISVSSYFQHEKDQSGDVVIINDDSLLLGLEQESIRLDEYDVVIFDEMHYLLAPNMRKKIKELGHTLIGFTATPTYEDGNKDRDLKQLFEVVSEDSILQWTLEGLLNSVQIFTIKVDSEEEVDPMVVELAAQMVTEKGRNVAVYCRPNSSETAKNTTDDLRACFHPRTVAHELEQRKIKAAAVGTFQNRDKNARLIKEFDKDELDVLATVGKLKVGWDSRNVNVIIIARRVTSLLDLQQMIGRGTRLSDEFPTTIIFEIIYDTTQCSVWEVYGLDEIEQGLIIGGNRSPERFAHKLRWAPGVRENQLEILYGEQHFNRRHWQAQNFIYPGSEVQRILAKIATAENYEANLLASPKWSIYSVRHDMLPTSHFSAKPSLLPPPVTVNELPRKARQAIEATNYSSVKEAIIGSRREHTEPTEGYIALRELAARYDMSVVRTAYRLTKMEYRQVGLWQNNPEGGLVFERFFESGADEYLRNHPDPPVVSRGEVTIGTMEEELRLSSKILQRLMQTEGIKGEQRRADGKQIHTRYSPEAYAAIAEVVSLMPWADETDVKVDDLAHELNLGVNNLKLLCDELKIYRRRKRFVRPLGDTDFAQHITAIEAQKLREDYFQYPTASDTDVNLQTLAKSVGVDYDVVLRASEAFDDEGKVVLRKLRDPRNNRPTRYLSETDAMVVAEKIQPDPLPAHLIPVKALSKLVNYTVTGARNALKKFEEPIALRLPKSNETYCVGWGALHYLLKTRSLRATAPQFDLAMLPMDEHDDDPAKIQAARALQRQLLPAHLLPPEAKEDPVEKLHAPTETAKPPILAPEAAKRPVAQRRIIPRQYAPNPHPRIITRPKNSISLSESLDTATIAERMGLPVEEVERAIKNINELSPLHGPKKINARGEKVPHYSGISLRAICIEVAGIGALGMQTYLKVPAKVIQDFLQSQGHRATSDGRYDRTAWLAAHKEFRLPPPGYEPLAHVALQVSQPDADIEKFVQHNGGKIDEFYNEIGQKCAYLSPLSAKLVKIQYFPHGELIAPMSNLNREEIAARANRPPEHFDRWLEGKLSSTREFTWARVRTHRGQLSGKILPFYVPEIWRAYLDSLG